MAIYDENHNVILNSNVNNTITYTGRRYDVESDLYFYRNRMYSAELGRFISKDPKGYVDGMNLYAYVKNNPLKYLDPMGTTSRNNVESPSMFDRIVSSTENVGNDNIVGGSGFDNYIGTNGSSFELLPAVDVPASRDTGVKFAKFIAKNVNDTYEGIKSIGTNLYNAGDYLARVSGYRDYQRGNIIPWYKYEAKLEYEVVKMAIGNEKIMDTVYENFKNDFKERPMYYIAGSITPSAILNVAPVSKVIIGVSSISIGTTVKLGTISDKIHTEINPLH